MNDIAENEDQNLIRPPFKNFVRAKKKSSFIKKLIIKHFFPKLEISIDMHNLRELAKNNSLVFLLTEGGILEEWFLEYILQSNEVCNIDFVSRHSSWSHFVHSNIFAAYISKLIQQYRKKVFSSEESLGSMYSTLRKSGHAVLYLDPDEYRKVHTLGESERYLEIILEISREYSKPVKVIPIIFLWRRSRITQESLFHLFFGSSTHPGFLRKLVFFFIRDRLGYLKDSKSIDINSFLIDSGSISVKSQVRVLRRKILTSISNEKRVILGPAYHSPSFIVERIMSDTEFIKILTEISNDVSETIDELTEQAAINLKNISSDYNFYLLEFISKLGHLFARNIFDRIVYDRKEFDHINELCSKHPIVFIPSHKSHVDYCLLSSIFFLEGHAPPRVASGDNLNFWPLGPVLRKCGAFFIKRTFRGDRLYSECLRFYIEYLLKFGYNQEFFIEGGRSRTGKLLYPRYGLLSYYVNAVARGVVDDLYISPISISYDTVAETSSYTMEQKGSEKKKESLGRLLKVKKALGKRYGCAYLKFGNPISLKEYLLASGIDYAGASREEKRLLIKKLAFSVMRRIDRVTIITPVNITATVLLNAKNPGLYVDDLRKKVKTLFEHIKKKKLYYSDRLDTDFNKAFDYSIERLIKEKNVSVNYLSEMDRENERVLYVEPDKRLDANYHKNNILTFFVVRSIAMLSLKVCVKDKNMDIQYFWKNVEFLRNLLKFEFFFSNNDTFKKEILEELASLTKEGKVPENFMDTASKLVEDFMEMDNRYLLPFFESYYTVSRVLEKMTSKPFNHKNLISKIKLMYEKLLWTGEVYLSESHSEVNYSNALRLFESLNIISRNDEEIRVEDIEGSRGTLTFYRGNLRRYIKLCR